MNFETTRLLACAFAAFLIATVPASGNSEEASALLNVLHENADFQSVKRVEILYQRESAVLARFHQNHEIWHIYKEKLRPKSGSLQVAVIFESSRKIHRVFFPDRSGINSRLTGRRFGGRFEGLDPTTQPLKLGRDRVDAVSGATMSSALVVDAVNRGADLLKRF